MFMNDEGDGRLAVDKGRRGGSLRDCLEGIAESSLER